MKKISKILLYSLFLPLYLIGDVLKSKRTVWRKIGFLLLTLLIFGGVWWGGFNQLRVLSAFTLFEAGITDKVTKIKVSGTSMLPTIKDGSEITLYSPKKHGLARGDMVSFKNIETGDLHFLKRIVGLPGEKISIKNGYVFIEDKALKEDYTLNQLPTYGNTFLQDCESLTVPQDHFFVMGDNRTVSFDSRAVGFVAKADIDGVIKSKTQSKFSDKIGEAKILKKEIDSSAFLTKLNTRRISNKSTQLITHDTLNSLAQKRAEQINGNFEHWKNKTVPPDKLLTKSGYRYNSIYEFVTFGYLDEESIVNQIFESPTDKNNFLSSNYTEVGIGVTDRTYKECKYPVISVIISWPSTPTYDPSIVDSWAKEIATTNQILGTMQTWVGYPGADQTKVRAIIDLIAEQNVIATRIYNKMKNREWLTQKDDQDIKYYNESIKKSNKLHDEFFGSVKGASTKRGEKRRL